MEALRRRCWHLLEVEEYRQGDEERGQRQAVTKQSQVEEVHRSLEDKGRRKRREN